MRSQRQKSSPRAAQWMWRGYSFVALMLAWWAGSIRAAPTGNEYDVRAAWLGNFVSFTEWPADAMAGGNNTLMVGVLGGNPFREEMLRLLQSKPVGNRKLVITNCSSVAEAERCQVVYISNSLRDRWGSILAELKNRSVLTVGESREFVKVGGMIGMYVDEKRLVFDVNWSVARGSKLTLSSELLKMAKSVYK